MHVTIEINSGEGKSELSAVIAFCLALGGMMPADAATITGPDAPAIVPVPAPPVSVAVVPPAPVAIPTPPVPVAPAAVVPPPPAAVSVERDSKGLPWDERIHAGTRGKNNDQSWKRRKGVDDATVAAVTAELTAAGGVAPNVPAATVSPAPDVTAVADVPVPPAPVETIVVPAAVVPAPPAPIPAPPAPAASGVITFPALVAKCGSAKGGAGYTYEELDGMARGLGLGMFKDLMTPENAAMRPYFEALIEA